MAAGAPLAALVVDGTGPHPTFVALAGAGLVLAVVARVVGGRTPTAPATAAADAPQLVPAER